MVREIKEKYGFVHEVNEKVVVSLPVDGMPTKMDVTIPLKEALSRTRIVGKDLIDDAWGLREPVSKAV